MRTLKKIIFWLLAGTISLMALLLLTIEYLPGRFYSSYLEEFAVRQAKNHRVNLTIQEMKLNVFGLQAKTVEAFIPIPPAFLTLQLTDPKIKLGIMGLIKSSLPFEFSAKAYGGNFSSFGEIYPNSQNANFSAKLESLNLKEHPQILGLGVTSGVLNTRLEKFQIVSGKPSAGLLQYKLSNFARPLATSIRVRNASGRFSQIDIPRIENLQLDGSARLENQIINLDSTSLNSNLGQAALSGKFVLNAPQSSELRILVELSSDGSNFFGAYLPELSNNILGSDDKKFQVDISAALDTPKLHFTRVD